MTYEGKRVRVSAKTQRPIVFREVNERIARLDGFWEAMSVVSLLCECGTSGCIERVGITPADYEEVRRFPTRFVVTPRHVSRDGERIVRATSQFVVVEKTGLDATEAVRLDPRRIESAIQ
jgi:hypothetical protein